MNLLLSITVALLVGTWFLQGLNFAMIMSFAATILFCVRKVGYFAKLKTLVTMEVIGIFLTVVMQLLLQKFDLIETLIVLLLRMIFLLVVYIDTTVYVYVQQEERKEVSKK